MHALVVFLHFNPLASCSYDDAWLNNDHLIISGGGNLFGGVTTFECEEGYHIVGNNKLKCLSDGSWDHPAPTCALGNSNPSIHEGKIIMINAGIVYFLTLCKVLRLFCRRCYTRVFIYVFFLSYFFLSSVHCGGLYK